MNRLGGPRAISAVVSTGGATKLGVIGVVMLIGLAFTLTAAEASGDPYGDVAAPTGNLDGDPADGTGPADGAIVQVGADGLGGSLIVAYTDNVAFDGPGADIRVHTLDADFPAEATIEVSGDGVTFVSAGVFSDAIGDIDLDLGSLGLVFATSVRVTYVSGEQPGFDLDAVEALNQIGIDGASITLAPPSNADPGFSEHRVTATVTDTSDSGDVAIVGIPVSFEVTDGPSAGTSGSAVTDALGEATFGWNGASLGLDEVWAWLDFDGSGTRDEGEPAAEATKLWYGDTGTIELIDINGDDLAVGDLVEVVITDRDLDVDDSPNVFVVTVTSTTDPAGIAVTLTETGPQTGVFSAVIELAETSDESAGQLAAVDGDAISASYDDALDSAGEDPAPVEDSLTVGPESADADDASDEADHKVTICHRPPGNPDNERTLSVGAAALEAHLANGSTEGPCEDAASGEQSDDGEQSEEGDDSEQPSKREQAEQRKAERDAAFCERKGDDHPRCRDE